MIKVAEKKQIILDRKHLEELERKASIFEEILSILEDRYFGYLMEKTEEEKNISLPEAKKILRERN